MNPAVTKELKLSPAAASKLQSTFIQEAMKVLPMVLTSPGAKSALTPAQKTQRTLRMIGGMETKLAAMLTPAQRARWRQLTLQSIGASAALQPRVASGLGLTAGQRTRLTELVSDANEALATRLQNRTSPIRMPEMTRLQNEAKAKGDRALLVVLTPAQRAKWRAMLGKPMALSGFLGAPALGLNGF